MAQICNVYYVSNHLATTIASHLVAIITFFTCSLDSCTHSSITSLFFKQHFRDYSKREPMGGSHTISTTSHTRVRSLSRT